MQIQKIAKITALIFVFCSLIISTHCKKSQDIEILDRDDLFSLELGRLENQIDLFQIQGMMHKNRFFMKEGTFYISNGNAARVMKVSSYGDLLFLLYNPEFSPEPIMLKEIDDSGVITSRFAAKFNLKTIGEIVVDKEDNIYLEDQVEVSQQIQDDQLGIILHSRVLKINRKGQIAEVYGKEGIGNSLLPNITSIHVNDNNNLIVIGRISGAWLIYWYTPAGKIQYTAVIEEQKVPTENKYLTSIDKIIPDYDKNNLYIQITYYSEIIDAATNTKVNIEYMYSRIYTYNMESGNWEKYVQIPKPGKRKFYTESGELEIDAPPFEFLGVSGGEHYYIIRPGEPNKYQVTILDGNGQTQISRNLVIEDSEIYFKQLNITERGLIYGLLCYKNKVNFVWWRSDKLAGETNNEDS